MNLSDHTVNPKTGAMKDSTCHHYVSYSGVKLPLTLVNPLEEADIANRNTYFRAQFDEHGRMVQWE